jgi:hypothetical protein
MHKDPVRTSQETHYVSAAKPNRLMLFRETVAVYCENHTEHTNTVCEQNAEFYHIDANGTHGCRFILKVEGKRIYMSFPVDGKFQARTRVCSLFVMTNRSVDV